MKKFAYILLAISLFTFGGCRNKKQVLDKPDDLINRNTMVQIIADAYIIESAVHLSTDSLPKDQYARMYYKELFQRYDVTREQFVRSLDFYVSEESSADKLLTEASALVAQRHKENGDDVGIEEGDIPTSVSGFAPTDSNDVRALDVAPTP